ncbi:hypothetical protein B0T17DRAFT_542071 [Bombardia bombarda]|uniref:Uncharacterized protein n=1 Tax=Bombardia bombarda TaxID=252184 RepID=A0AA39T2I6_9PEZI|nr:hypothetical protein B0T17DRAFT_542071 [Bombardia bombarda]
MSVSQLGAHLPVMFPPSRSRRLHQFPTFFWPIPQDKSSHVPKVVFVGRVWLLSTRVGHQQGTPGKPRLLSHETDHDR